MKANIEHRNLIGIYCIENKLNGKKYVGKSICIHRRIKAHITNLNRKSKDENRHLINSWHKYGRDNFTYSVLEVVEEELLSSRELHWILELNTLDRKLGYNLRLDSSNGMEVSEETRELLSKAGKARYEDPEERFKTGQRGIMFWNSDAADEDFRSDFADSISKSRTTHKFYQCDKDDDSIIIQEWNSIRDILKANPSYKRGGIYSVCSGEKPSMYGYKWKKVKI